MSSTNILYYYLYLEKFIRQSGVRNVAFPFTVDTLPASRIANAIEEPSRQEILRSAAIKMKCARSCSRRRWRRRESADKTPSYSGKVDPRGEMCAGFGGFYKSTERTGRFRDERGPILQLRSYIFGSPWFSIRIKYDPRCSEGESGKTRSPYPLIVSASKTHVTKAIFYIVRSSRSSGIRARLFDERWTIRFFICFYCKMALKISHK